MSLNVHRPLRELALSQRIVRRNPNRPQSICARKKGKEKKGDISLKCYSVGEATQIQIRLTVKLIMVEILTGYYKQYFSF